MYESIDFKMFHEQMTSDSSCDLSRMKSSRRRRNKLSRFGKNIYWRFV